MTTRSGTAWVFWSETEVRKQKRDRVRGEGLCCLLLCVAGTCCLAAPDCPIIDSGVPPVPLRDYHAASFLLSNCQGCISVAEGSGTLPSNAAG